MSTTATTTTTMTRMARNMDVKHTRRPRAAAHTAWLRHLVCAVSVAATLCCFIPGALSPFPMHIPAERGRKVVESWKKDKIENHPATMLDNASVLKEAFDILREYVPRADETLKEEFLAFSDPLKDSPKVEMTSVDVERYVGSRPKLEAMAKSLSSLQMDDFDRVARIVLHYTKLNGSKLRWLWSGSTDNMNDLIMEEGIKKELNPVKLGFVTASFSQQDEYSERPSDVSDDFKAWVQAGVRRASHDCKYEVKLTMHPNVKSNESEGTIISFYGTYYFEEHKRVTEKRTPPKLIEKRFELKDFNFASPTGKREDGWTVKTTLINGFPNQTIREFKTEDDLFLLCNNSTNSLRSNSWTKFANYETSRGWSCSPPPDVTEREMRHVFGAEVDVPETTEEHARKSTLEIYRDNDFGHRLLKSNGIERVYTLINSDCLEKPFFKDPLQKARPDKQRLDLEQEELKGKYTSRLRIYQRQAQWYRDYVEEDDEDQKEMNAGMLIKARLRNYRRKTDWYGDYVEGDNQGKKEINIGMLVEDRGQWGHLSSPLAFNIERLVLPQPDGSEKTIRVRRHLTYKSAENMSVMHTCQVDASGVKTGSYEYDTSDSVPFEIRAVWCTEDAPHGISPVLGPKILEDNAEESTHESKERKSDNDSSKTPSSNDGAQSLEDDEQSMECEADVSIKGPDSEGKKGSLICNMLIDGGLFFFGIITIFIILATGLESLRKRERVGRIQSQIRNLS